MRKVSNKVAVVCSLFVVASMSLYGCAEKGSLEAKGKKELIALVNDQNTELEGTYSKIEELETTINNIKESEAPAYVISEFSDGTGKFTFNSYQNKVKLPVNLEYPGSSQVSNTASINITSALSVVPTSNWSLKLNGTSLELEHSNGISGSIKASKIKESVEKETIQTAILQPVLKEFPPEKIIYNKLFLDDNWWGIEAKVPTYIDEEPAYFRCGAVGIGEQAFVYTFVYKGEQSDANDEVVLSLLKTIKFFGQTLRIE